MLLPIGAGVMEAGADGVMVGGAVVAAMVGGAVVAAVVGIMVGGWLGFMATMVGVDVAMGVPGLVGAAVADAWTPGLEGVVVGDVLAPGPTATCVGVDVAPGDAVG